RQATKVLYPLDEILLLMLCATIAGADDFVEIGLWGSEHQDFLRRFLPYERSIPSHDTLCDVIAAIDPELFKSCFLAWVDGLRTDVPEVIAIDGKTSRRSHDRR
uniref:ISAs1 family transposase n=1 Tax=Acidisphaera sp. S103 TaxID=1747223 RepID=UPI00131AD94D